MGNWKSVMKIIILSALILIGDTRLYGRQQSKPPKPDSLESVEVAVRLNSGGDGKADPMFKLRSDGAFESVPEGATLTVEIKGVLSGKTTTVALTGKFVALVEGVPIFRTAERLTLAFYPNGRILPCFTETSISHPGSVRDGNSDRFLRAWMTDQFTNMRKQVRTLSDHASKGDGVASKTLGFILHPDSRRELVRLQSSPNKDVSSAAKGALSVWTKMRTAAVSRK